MELYKLLFVDTVCVVTGGELVFTECTDGAHLLIVDRLFVSVGYTR
jgi:hypothetical protein